MLPPARILAGRYRLGRLIGEGGMGAVYEAEHIDLGAVVAVKLLSDRLLGDADAVERFRREARAAASIRHDNVVRVTDSGTDEEGTPFLVMERLHGESLGSLLKRHRRLPAEAAAAVAQEVLRGLEAAHAQGIIHRDLKPGNVFLSWEGEERLRVKLLDFGISKLLGGVSELTAEGAIVGTPHYMSPEQLRGRLDLDPRSDLYAVGVLLFRMLAGKLPFEGKRPQELYQAILQGRRRRLEALRPDLPEALHAVVDRALRTAREARFSSARQMREALKAALPELPDRLPTLLAAPPDLSSVASRSAPSHPEASAEADPSTAPTLRAAGAAAPPATHHPLRTETAPATSRGHPASRRIPLLLLGFVLISLVVWWAGRSDSPALVSSQHAPSPDPSAGRPAAPLPLFVVRYAAAGTAERNLGGLVKHLGRSLGRPVALRVLEPHAPVASALRQRAALAALSAYKYVRAEREVPGLRLLATAVRRGGPWYQGLVVARSDAPIQRLADLRGGILCLVHETSTSGYLYPRAMLRRAGLDPDADLRATRLTGDHLASLRALAHGACDAAAIYANALYKEAPRHGIDPGSFLVVAQTGRIPYDAYVASPALSSSMVERVRAALLDLRPESTRARRVLGEQNDLRGFQVASPEAYHAVRELAEHMERSDTRAGPEPAQPPRTEPDR